jgi:hypothetical protein
MNYISDKEYQELHIQVLLNGRPTWIKRTDLAAYFNERKVIGANRGKFVVCDETN